MLEGFVITGKMEGRERRREEKEGSEREGRRIRKKK